MTEASNFRERKKKEDPNNPLTKQLVMLHPEDRIMDKFKQKNILAEIKKELDKDHKEDDNLKMTVFLTGTTGLLKNPKDRKSIALKGDPSVGKDNLKDTILKHMPKEIYISVTSATQATIEDDIKDKRIIAFSELNVNRDEGANKHLVEVIKQKAEGGTSAIKKDKRDGMKSSRHEIGEQGTVIYGTTETEKDDELGTRFIIATVESKQEKIKTVNNNTCTTFSDKDLLLNQLDKEDSWIRKGLTYFFNNNNIDLIVLPYSKYFIEKIDGNDIFDNTNPRSQRDIKRLLSLTCATTYIFQLQREKIDYKGKTFLISKPEDFILTLMLAGEFFNQTYEGTEKRLMDILNIMKDEGSEWVARDSIQIKLGKSTNTIKHWCNILSGDGLIEGQKGINLNNQYSVTSYNGNKIYYRRCQNAIKKPLIRCQVSDLQKFLEEKTNEKIDTFEFLTLSNINEENDTKKGIKNEGVNLEKDEKKQENLIKKQEIDTFLLTPSKLEASND